MTNIQTVVVRFAKAFTIVELMVVVAIISILSGGVIASTTKVQQDARDSERETKANIIASSIEKYYNENNEYPSCTKMTAPAATVKSSTLTSLVNTDALRAPRQAVGTNSVQCAASVPNTTTTFTYTCLSTTSCNKWELGWRNEADGAVKTIASLYTGNTAPTGTVTAATPSVSISSQISGASAIGTGSATCNAQGGTPYIEIRSYKNSGSFPGTWTASSSQTVTPLNEGESGTFQAQAQCQLFGATSSAFVQTASDTATRSVTAPTGLTTSAAISGANAIGTFTGGSCATGTTLQRQIEYYQTYHPWVGAWSAFEDLVGSTKTLPINEGWQYNFHQIARCVNTTTGVASDWTWSPTTATAVRPINQFGPPSVGATGNAANVSFNWNGAACPTQTNKEYQFVLANNGGYSSDWWGPTSGTTFDWGDTTEGFTFTSYVQQRCSTYFTTAAWSGNGAASWYRGINAPGRATNLTQDRYAGGRTLISFNWDGPACG
ncbi:prepilin-type N-terminal cleavage/methylation domain-containing protein, partial [Candidatus Saccharibacteria bacterium]|nr:prepilin-type N-terminal cleavage/methylation domain-containing protein [Candidatus Saccharibacteria bacterium]